MSGAAGGGPFSRYVALGDSSTEGLDDPYEKGPGYRGWADRLARRLADLNPDLGYANLAVRGRLTHQVHEQQLGPALALEPDLATVVAGMNDLLRPGFDLDTVAGHLEAMQLALVAAGATVVSCTYPDPSPFMPIARPVRARFLALNDALREGSARSGALLVDLGRHPAASDPRLWSVDRLHANPDGHARIAHAVAHALGLPGADGSWADPLPPVPIARRHERVAAELVWAGRYFVPWLVRRARGRSSGDGVTAKRPRLEPLGPP